MVKSKSVWIGGTRLVPLFWRAHCILGIIPPILTLTDRKEQSAQMHLKQMLHLKVFFKEQ